MFRRKDNETTPGGETRAEAPLARPVAETKPMPQPSEAPRRGVEPAPAAAPTPAASADAGGKRLMVGQGISLSGEITSCDRLIVEGDVQVTLNETRAIEIAESGRFTNGKASVEEAEISGVYEGELTVRNRLLIRATGRVKGTVRYGELELERGGRISGTISMIDDK
ncbi:MAG: polymer-forming cytoskeletal protein [Geminicoccaceae bacterium]|nr:polymer-forming cytoskeletal protein [Geminicoccaceae bacterium]